MSRALTYSRAIAAGLLLCACLSSSCALDGELEIAQRDFDQFRDEVYPVLMRDCAFHTCHGNAERFYRISGSARGRLDPMRKALAETQPEEVELSYRRSLAMINARDPGASLLLRKPLAPAVGGAGHLGTDSFGRDVFESDTDPDYLVIAKWVFGER
jgi:hypothetical protein